LLSSHLSMLDRESTYTFVGHIMKLVNECVAEMKQPNLQQTQGAEKAYREIKSLIPRPEDKKWNPPGS